MTGRNPWVVLCVAEDAPYHEVQRAFRRRVKQTHPDSGGDAGEFDTVVRAFEVVRESCAEEGRPRAGRPTQSRPTQSRPSQRRATPYDRWLRPSRPAGSWTDDGGAVTGGWSGSAGHGAVAGPGGAGNDFSGVLADEMAKVGATAC